ncbi:MAG: hypothetical protein V4724_37820 [Pseudomonadota bacterium]
MTETPEYYNAPGHDSGPEPDTLLPFHDPSYRQPEWADIRAVVQISGLSGLELANLVGVSSRTVRKWLSPPMTANHAPMPYAAWRLLLIACNLAAPPAIDKLSA